MGFMDKAKKMAEQAQQKLDETQKQFNKGQSGEGQPEQGGVRYDQHGRPIPATEDAPPEGAAPPPSAQPAETPAPDPEAPPPPAEPASKPEGDTDQNPDPFKPLQ